VLEASVAAARQGRAAAGEKPAAGKAEADTAVAAPAAKGTGRRGRVAAEAPTSVAEARSARTSRPRKVAEAPAERPAATRTERKRKSA